MLCSLRQLHGLLLLEPTAGGTKIGQALMQQPDQLANARFGEAFLTTGRPASANTAEAAHVNIAVGSTPSSEAVLGGHDASLKDVQFGIHSPADSVVASATIAAADSDTSGVSAAAHPPPDHVSASVVPKPADDMPKNDFSAIAVTASSATAAPSNPTLVSDKLKST